MNNKQIAIAALIVTAMANSAPSSAEAVTKEIGQKGVMWGLAAASHLKTATVEFFNTHKRFPTSNAEAGAAAKIENSAVTGADIVAADNDKSVTIKITLGSWAYPSNILVLRGEARPGGVFYACGVEGTTVDPEWIPDVCQKTMPRPVKE